MKTNNMPEDELDDLFRKSASAYEPEFDEAAWEGMENKLDAHMHQKALWRKLGWASLLVLLVGLGTFLGLRETGKPETVATQAEKLIEAPVKKLPTETLATKNTTAEINKIPNSKPIVSNAKVPNKVNALPKTAVANKPKTQVMVGNTAKRQFKVPLLGVNNQPKKQTSERKSKSADFTTQGISKIIIADQKQPETTVAERSNIGNLDQQANTIGNEQVQENDLASSANLTAANDSNATISKEPFLVTDKKPAIPSDSTVNKSKKSPLHIGRFALTVLAAPDLSSVGFSNPGGVSTNAGVLLSYAFADKWQVSTGIIKARKIYTAQPGDYKSKPAFWDSHYKMEGIDAVCQVLDIPVTIGYRMWQKNKSGLTLNTGLSSYLMQNERYDYEYMYYGQEYYKTWEVANQNRHVFSIYNLSLGYARQISKSLHVGAEPFIKVPLTGIGAGKVKLASTGVFFSLSFRAP